MCMTWWKQTDLQLTSPLQCGSTEGCMMVLCLHLSFIFSLWCLHVHVQRQVFFGDFYFLIHLWDINERLICHSIIRVSLEVSNKLFCRFGQERVTRTWHNLLSSDTDCVFSFWGRACMYLIKCFQLLIFPATLDDKKMFSLSVLLWQLRQTSWITVVTSYCQCC